MKDKKTQLEMARKGIILAPVCSGADGGMVLAGRALYQFYHPICHQLPDRTIFLGGHPMATCVRCSSVM